MNENPKRPDATDDAESEDAVGYVAGDPAVVDDTDIPVNPDERTIAETEAAYDAVHYGKPDTRRFRKPKSIALMLLVLFGIVGLGIYSVIWLDNLRQRNEKIELRELERRHVMATLQQKNTELKQRQMDLVMPGMTLKPANNVYQPLGPKDKARYDALFSLYGTQFQPGDNEKALIDETRNLRAQYPATAPAPATGPANPGGSS